MAAPTASAAISCARPDRPADPVQQPPRARQALRLPAASRSTSASCRRSTRRGSPAPSTTRSSPRSTTSTWTTSGSAISAPDNFAALPGGQPVTIKSGGPATMSPPRRPAPRTARPPRLLHAQVPVPAGHEPRALPLDLRPRRPHARQRGLHRQPHAHAAAGLLPAGVTSLGPAVAITGPTVAATVDTPTPTLTGTAATARATADGDRPDLQRSPRRRARRCRRWRRRALGNTWSAPAAAAGAGPVHRPGHAGQRAGSTASARRRPSRSSPAGGGRARSRGRWLEQPAELRRPRQRRHPRRPGHLRRLAAAGPRQDVRRARGLRERLHQVPAGHGAARGDHPAEGVRAAQGRGERPDGRAARHARRAAWR